MKFPPKEIVERLRKQYPEGTRSELVSMNDPYSQLKPGDRGTVSFVDDTGTIFANWDSGSGLGLVYGEDSYKVAQNEVQYKTGADFWRDTAVKYGIEEAFGICGRYLDTQLGHPEPDSEHQFCRELFAAMHEATAGKTDPAKLVYPYQLEKADERMEIQYYHDSRERKLLIFSIKA